MDRLDLIPTPSKDMLRETVDSFKLSFDVDNIRISDIQAFGDDGVENDESAIGSVVEELQLDLQMILAALQADLASFTQFHDVDSITLGQIDVARLALMETDMQKKIDIEYDGDSDDEDQKECHGLEIAHLKILKDCVSRTLKLRTSALDCQEKLQEKRQSTPKRQNLESLVALPTLTSNDSLQTSPVVPQVMVATQEEFSLLKVQIATVEGLEFLFPGLRNRKTWSSSLHCIGRWLEKLIFKQDESLRVVVVILWPTKLQVRRREP